MDSSFPPTLEIGARVWTNRGYPDHGPLEGPKVNIAAKMGGTVRSIEPRFLTMDYVLYVVQWDNGQVSKHYSTGIFCIGRFQTYQEFVAAITVEGPIELTLGSQRGFREAKVPMTYDGVAQTVHLLQSGRDLWNELLEPLAKRKRIKVNTTRIKAARRK